MHNFANSSLQTIELSAAPNLYSGRTKFRICLVLVGMCSFFSLTLLVNHRIQTEETQLAFIDGTLYFVHNLFLAAFSFAMIPLADFQLFEFNSSFWNIFKSLSTYSFLAEAESVLQFAYSYCTDGIWATYDDEEVGVVLHLVALATLRFFLMAALFWNGSSFLQLIVKTRGLPNNFYVSFKVNFAEYLLWHLIGYLLVSQTELSEDTFFLVVAMFVPVIAYFTVRHLRASKSMKLKRFYKASVN